MQTQHAREVEAQKKRRREEGFSLLEALIALVIIMIGLLGVAGLQALGVRSGSQAHLRSQAAFNVHSLAASMRANSAYWSESSAAASLTIKASVAGGIIVAPAIASSSSANCLATRCTPQEIASYNLTQWGKQLIDMQHDAQATIVRIANAGTSAGAYRITLQWSERRMQGQGVTQSATLTRATSVVVQP